MQGYIGKSVNIVKSQITDFKNILTNIENAELGTQNTKVNLLQGLNQLDTMFTFSTFASSNVMTEFILIYFISN